MKFLPFQKEDLARGIMHRGRVYGLDTGGGKTVCGLADVLLQVGWHVVPANAPRPGIPLAELSGDRLCPDRPALIVAPGDLHAQWMEEARDKFHAELYPIATQEDFGQLVRGVTPAGQPVIPPAFYIVSYQQLTQNGVEKMPDVDAPKTDPHALLARLCLPITGGTGRLQARVKMARELAGAEQEQDTPATSVHAFFGDRGETWKTEYRKFELDPATDNLAALHTAYDRETAAVRTWKEKKLAAAELRRLGNAFAVLENLMPARLPKHGSDAQIYDALTTRQQTWIIREFLREVLAGYERGLGSHRTYERSADGAWTVVNPELDQRAYDLEDEDVVLPERRTIRCVYSPSLAELSWQAFGHVTVEEGEKMQGEDTLIGRGVRLMNPEYRLLLAATPIKNRLPQIFRLAWWAAGGLAREHARFPYPDSAKAREEFTVNHMVSERNLTKEAAAKASGSPAPSSRFTKLTAEVCQVHLLWKLFGPLIQRRLKADFGVPIVARIRKAIRVPMGTEQSRVYRYHLEADYRDKDDLPATGARLQALRAVASDPTSTALEPVPGGAREPCPVCSPKGKGKGNYEINTKTLKTEERCPRCGGTSTIPLPHQSTQALTPKLMCALQLIQEILARKEQVVVFSALLHPLDSISQRLTRGGVRHIVADGRTSPAKRGPLIGTFKAGRVSTESVPVMLAGAESTASGHNLFRANNVILIAYTWAANLYKQALDRVHRITSTKDINVYVILCEGTIDPRMESMTDEKQDAAGLVLDGKLLGELPVEVNLAELLAGAYTTFDTKATTVDESLLVTQWPQMQDGLRTAQSQWDEGLPLASVALTQSAVKLTTIMARKTKPTIEVTTRFNPLSVLADTTPTPAAVTTPVPQVAIEAAVAMAQPPDQMQSALLATLAAFAKPTASVPLVAPTVTKSVPVAPAEPVSFNIPVGPAPEPATQPATPAPAATPEVSQVRNAPLSAAGYREKLLYYRNLADRLAQSATADV